MLKISTRSIIKVALPLMFGTFIQSIIAFTDAAFVSQLGTISFDAVGNASLIYMALYMLTRGLGDGTQIRIANEYGKENLKGIGAIFSNALSLQIVLSFSLILILVSLVPSLVTAISNSKLIALEMGEYLKFRGFGFLFASLELIIIGFIVGIGKTRIILISTCILAAINIVLDYGLIFGNLGMPELGIKGAALASSFAEFCSFFFLLIYVFRNKNFKEFALKFKPEWNKKLTKNLARLSTPLMFQGFISISTWLVFFTFIEQMGEKELEASQTIRHLYFLAFIPIFGFGMATKTFVSNLRGQNKIEEIPRLIFKICILSASSLIIIFHGAIFYPEFLVSIVNQNPEVNELASDILQMVSGSMIIFAITSILFNAISGLGETNTSFYIEVITIVAYIICCLVLFKVLHWTVKWTWIVEYLYFCLNGILSVFYLRYYFKKSMK